VRLPPLWPVGAPVALLAFALSACSSRMDLQVIRYPSAPDLAPTQTGCDIVLLPEGSSTVEDRQYQLWIRASAEKQGYVNRAAPRRALDYRVIQSRDALCEVIEIHRAAQRIDLPV